jgi:[acyl-carrier-protein] S-malonyltransferase
MSRQRALVLCPGRGSYGRPQLGSLRDRPSLAVDTFDRVRAARGLTTVRGLDSADRYGARLHVAGENASILTAACSLADIEALDPTKVDVVAICGNSMGWYTALAASGCLSLEDAGVLIETLGSYQAGNVVGGQIIYPLVDPEWRRDDALVARVQRAVADVPGLHWSIRLGGSAVLGGDDEALRAAAARLPVIERGTTRYPLKLPLHSAFHTPHMAGARARAEAELGRLDWRSPHLPLIDGRGGAFAAGWADPAAIRSWTLGPQINEAFDFNTMLATAMGEFGPDIIVLPGPGATLGGAVAQLLISTGWQGIHSKADFLERQKSRPILVSMAWPDQRALVASP